MASMGFLTISVFVLVFALISRRIHRSPMTAPMIFTLFGVLLAPGICGVIHLSQDAELVRILAEVTLLLVLFLDASRIDLAVLWSCHMPAIRLLFVGIPLMLALATGVGQWILGLSFPSAFLLAAVLTPTDAALGQVMVSSPNLPNRVKQTFNVESGLNDGLIVPIVLVGLAWSQGESSPNLGYLIPVQLFLSPILGVAVALVGSAAVRFGIAHKTMSESFQQFSVVATAFLAFSLAELVHANGFLASFVAGLTLGTRRKDVSRHLLDFGEAESQLLNLIVFMLFGATLVWSTLPFVSWQVVAYALLSVLVFRPLSAGLSLLGLGLKWPTLLLFAWFGPRGIASILFALVLLQGQVPGFTVMIPAITWTVVFSIVLHGGTSFPFSMAYSAWAVKHCPEEAAELAPVQDLPNRISQA